MIAIASPSDADDTDRPDPEAAPETAPEANRLIHEASPYLRQHAHNPVDWRPWGEAAFEEARAEDKPIFLSIGYSTCHWCHVMAHESFEDPEIARMLNEAFVNVKVDREERPDVDGLYMTVCQLLTGHGGWPLTVLLTPEARPFFAATYIPKETRFGQKGLRELIPRVQELWTNQREEVLRSAEQITDALTRAEAGSRSQDELGEPHLRAAFEGLRERYDEAHGGFGAAPKFPSPHNLLFLLRHADRTDDATAQTMATATLEAIRRGGVYDQVGFGLHRYATDAEWHLPHFEKMLYDQAMGALAFLAAWQATGEPRWARTAQEILAYLERDLQAPEGAFYSAEDADSEGGEGAFYVWTEEEIRTVLEPEEAELVTDAFGVRPEGNYREEATGEPTGRNVLHQQRELPPDERALWLQARAKLYRARENRPRPHRDEKILTDWNGLAVAAFARAGAALDSPHHTQVAQRTADWLLATMGDTSDGSLWHRYRAGEAGVVGFLDDYAFLTWGLIELYEATLAPRYLRRAGELAETMLERFADPEHGGLFFTEQGAKGAADVLVRQKTFEDRAIPSGNSVALDSLIRLGRLTGRADWEERAAELARAAGASVTRAPIGFTHLLSGLDRALGPSQEIVVVGNPEASDFHTMLQAIRSRFLPRTVLLGKPMAAPDEPAHPADELAELAPFTAPLRPIEGHATAYVCHNHSCERPTTDLDELIRQITA